MVEIWESIASEVSGTTEMDNSEHLPQGYALYRRPQVEEAGRRGFRRPGSPEPYPGGSVWRQTFT